MVDFPLREISLASQRGIAEHSAALASRARVLQQVSQAGAWGCGEGKLLGGLGSLCPAGRLRGNGQGGSLSENRREAGWGGGLRVEGRLR